MDGMIYKKIAAVMAEIGAVGKNDWNAMQKFKFRGIDAVMNALHPVMAKHGIFVVPEVLEQTREERKSRNDSLLIYSICKIKYTFFAEDGSSISSVVIGEGMDSGDKATNKAMAIALKYAFFQVFCIPTEEMTDPDAESPEVKPKEEKPAEKPAERPAERPAQKEDKISEVKISTLKNRCEKDGVDLSAITSLYKLQHIQDMTEAMFRNALDHWDKVVEMYGKK